MRPLTLLMPDLDRESVIRTAALFDRLAAGIGTSPECEGPNSSAFAPTGNPAYASGSCRTWDDGGLKTTLWSDGMGFRIVFRFDSADGAIDVETEMPKVLTFLRDRSAKSRLAADLAKRLRSCVTFDDPRAVSTLTKADGILAAMSYQIAQETGRTIPSVPAVVRLPSPLMPNEAGPTFARRGRLDLVPTRSFTDLMRRRIPSTLRVSAGPSDSRIMISAERREVAVAEVDAMDMLRMARKADGHVPRDHPPLVEWQEPWKEQR
jgi:hypothetical protein